MDYLTRLIAGYGTSPSKQKAKTPAERLATCQRICGALQQLWRNGDFGPDDETAVSQTANLLDRLNTLLLDESRKAAPHSCLSYVGSSQVYIVVTKLALLSRNTTVIQATAQFFHTLINGEAEGLLDGRLFARSVLDLVRYSTVDSGFMVTREVETSLIELLFSAATKIRLDPGILPAWFHPERDRSRPRNAAGDYTKNQFPLFYVLVGYVHHDGAIGDFARTGLLYLTETASKSRTLETWMIESDLAPQMASGLGALYSRLSRQIPQLSEHEKSLPILALSDFSQQGEYYNSHPEDAQQSVRAFLSYLAFWQDTLNHCTSVEVKETLLDYFQVLFVQQLLYPSLLESSDVDGGSTPAVLTHLYRILDSLEHPQLVQRMLRYLLATQRVAEDNKAEGGHHRRLSISRRKSIEHVSALAEMAKSPSPTLFNLLDLLVMSLKSNHAETVNASLKLLTIVINKHHCYVRNGLFHSETDSNESRGRDIRDFNIHLLGLFDMATVAAQSENMDASYTAALIDAQVLLEKHICHSEEFAGDSGKMKISSKDKLFESLILRLQTFFANDTLTNLYLTETLVSLATCEHIDVHSWLLTPKSETLGRVMPENVKVVLSKLVDQIRQWRTQFSDWETLVARRRQELVIEEQPALDLHPVFGYTEPSTPGAWPSPPASPSRQQTNSPTASPRGRKIPNRDNSFFQIPQGSPGQSTPSRSKHLAISPLRQAYFPDHAEQYTEPRNASSDIASMKNILKTQITLHLPVTDIGSTFSHPSVSRAISAQQISRSYDSVVEDAGDSGTMTPPRDRDASTRNKVSLSHVLTNAIILQEFVLELAAVIQVRATLFGEVDLC